ncbi:TolC family protein [Bacteroides graminisolvens]|uniref:TolC family protein n=1 Tax=Bacteroides graminisolvens TaxID=477666 RepID=UPI002409C416|nr:TolC family protein [Bacteroides graminisolvens]
MNYRILISFLTLLLLQTGALKLIAQEITVSDYSNLQANDYLNLKLPPLDSLFENAKQGPIYQLAAVKEQIEKKILAKERKAFLSFFSIRGSYQYGTFSNDASYSDLITPVISTYSTAAQTNYTVGGAVSIPLDGLFDLAPRVRRQKLLVKTAQLEREMKFEELKREIIQLYVTANAQLNTLKLRAEAVVLETAQYEITEKDFTNGTIESKELSNQKSTQSHAIENYENSKAELNKSLMILEVITHSTIIKK